MDCTQEHFLRSHTIRGRAYNDIVQRSCICVVVRKREGQCPSPTRKSYRTAKNDLPGNWEKPLRRPVGYYIDLLRRSVSEILMHDFDNENGSLLVAVLTGDKSYMSDETYDSFIESGIVHIMAVSGLHLSIWVAFLSLFMDFRGRKGRIMAALMIVFTVFMMNFACFTGSVKRASAMTVLYFIGKILGKRTDALNSLGFAAVCGLIVNPFGVLDISFLLSFFSTMGIIIMGVPLSEKIDGKLNIFGERIKRILSALFATVSLSLSVTIFVFPVSVLVLGKRYVV